jgi:hypothetical protein
MWDEVDRLAWTYLELECFPSKIQIHHLKRAYLIRGWTAHHTQLRTFFHSEVSGRFLSSFLLDVEGIF